MTFPVIVFQDVYQRTCADVEIARRHRRPARKVGWRLADVAGIGTLSLRGATARICRDDLRGRIHSPDNSIRGIRNKKIATGIQRDGLQIAAELRTGGRHSLARRTRTSQ